MKRILLLLCFMSAATAFSQNTDPQPLQNINWNDTVFTSPTQTKFALGWQWAGPAKAVNQRLHINTLQNKFGFTGTRTNLFKTVSDTGAPSDIVWELFEIPDNWQAHWGMDAASMQFDPTAPLSPAPPRSGDSTGAVWGFATRDITYGAPGAAGTENFNRYLLDTAGIPAGGVVVLKDPVLDEDYWQGTSGHLENSGRQWYISINLRRTDSLDQSTGNQPVLTIKVPFERINAASPDSIIFDSIAVASASGSNLETLPFGRGLALKLQAAPNSSTKEFVITRDMLPRYGTTGALPRDITISAFFRFRSKNFDPTAQNFRLKGLDDTATSINKLKLEVKYHGNNKVAIDWLRFEVPYARGLFRGYEDTTRFSKYVQHVMETVRDSIEQGHNIRLRSFYGTDEPANNQWRTMRYFTRLFNKRLTTELLPYLYNYVVQSKMPWHTGMPGAYKAEWGVPPTMPFIKYGNQSSATLGFKDGWGDVPRNDSSGSAYDSYVKWGGMEIKLSGSSSDPAHRSKNYPDYTLHGADGGPLASFEGMLWNLAKDYKKDFLYDGSSWWTNIWGSHNWSAGKDITGMTQNPVNQHKRPTTGEEMRLQIWSGVILGAKGLMYERMYSERLVNKNLLLPGHGTGAFIGMMNAPDSVTSGFSGDSIIQSNLGGGDFIINNDYTHLDQYMDMNIIAQNLGVEPNRIYIGHRSTRREVLKANDRIHIIGDTLMRLRLAAWYGKGYGEIQNNDGTRELQNFLRVGNSLGIVGPGFNTPLTRPVGRVNYREEPYFEPWDSAFVDYTILRDTAVPTTDGFFVGCLNRRTNPLVRWPNGSGGDSLRFFTTAEFDSISAADPSWRYKQGGARTITIPFSVNNSSGYALLRVQELGGGIDTIVGQDKNLDVNFLPGEGKIFKVTVLPPDNSPSGLLSYSNQRKMVAVPIDGNMDSVRYHMTYYKNIPVLPPSPPRLGVYYRRSMPTNGKTNEENIKWEPGEELISKYITTPNGIDSTCDCMYPAITARYDSSNAIMTTYVVYNCKENLVTVSQNDVMIAETKFASERNRMLPIAPLYGQFLDDVAGKDSSLWGIPSINASAQGNYYAWNDSTSGIAIGYKTPGAATFSIPRKYISWDNPAAGITAHPSLNTYSHISWNENDCAVVWQEGLAPYTQICYARPYYNSFFGSINLIRMTGGIGIDRNGLEINNDSTILKVSNAICTQDNKFPVVYRAIESTLGTLGIYPSQRIYSRDRIAWEGNTMYMPYKRIFYRMLDFVDLTSPVPPITKSTAYWMSRKHSGIYAMRRGLHQPDISQGSYKKLGGFINNSDSAMVLSFVQGALFSQSGPTSSSLMWHVPMRLWSNLAQADTNTITSQRTRGVALSGNGQLSHLAARPDLTDRSQWKQTRRIYQKGEGAPPTIAETAQHFYRTGINTQEQAIVAPGFAYDCMPLIIIDPTVDEVPLRFNTPEPIVDTALNVTLPPADTIRTNWFTIGSSAELTTYFHGTDTSNVRLELVERTTMSVVVTPIPLETSTDSTVQEIKYTFLNGGNSEYRLEFMKTNNDAEFIEDILVGELEIDSVGSPRAGTGNSKGRHVFDLTKKAVKGTSSTDGLYISSYPNPVQDEITITCSQDAESLERNGRGFYSRNEITLAISDPVGRTIANYTLSPGASVTVPTQNLPSGVYIIRASGSIFGKASATFIVQH